MNRPSSEFDARLAAWLDSGEHFLARARVLHRRIDRLRSRDLRCGETVWTVAAGARRH